MEEVIDNHVLELDALDAFNSINRAVLFIACAFSVQKLLLKYIIS